MINIDNTQLKEMFRGGYQNLMLNKDYVDQLNVFPVPDGDTGTNMGLTMTATIKEMDLVDGNTVKETAISFAKGALKGARGNSGVILSQIFRGMSEVLSDVSSINTKIFAKALLSGSNKAYDAVTQPKEGTILTVIRVIGEFAVKTAGRTSDFLDFFTKILQKGEDTLKDTPRLLPVLAKAGVVDSGGQGLMFILIGMYNVLAGVEMKPYVEETKEAKTVDFELDEHDLENIKYAYCTEFFIINLKPITTMADIDRLRDNLSNIGDCVLVVGDLQMVKVHVHTNTPDKALGYALAIGELNLPKIENMLEQNRVLQANKKKERKETGLLAISSGEGFKNIFLELGADKVLEGGQTMNPSVDDIVKYITDINANNVFVLPNNKNIILACEQAQKLVEFNLVVIATYNAPEGVAAAMAYDMEGEIESVKNKMISAAKAITCIQVTHAVRDTELDGFNLHNGDIIALEKKIVAQGKNVDDVVLDSLAQKDKDAICVITMYYGIDITEEQAEILREKIQKMFPDSDVMVVDGGQPHYYYLISLE